MVEILPAIDIRGGNCVRLDQGDPDKETVFSKEPIAMAQIWERQGASRIHVVDLDGAFEGFPKNLDTIVKIAKAVNIPVQMGGGIRTLHAVDKIIESGVDRVVLGTTAVSNIDMVKKAVEKYGEKIVVGVDASNGKIAIKGWKEITDRDALDFVKELEKINVITIVYTDISRDGMLMGPNIESIRKLSESTSISVIASGGISSLDDLKNIKELESAGVTGVIVGKALYTGEFELKEALDVMRE